MSTVEPDSFLGREIAGYRIEEEIGRGGMGVVYRAEHLRLGRKVALKVVAPQIAREEKFRDRFLRESRTAGTLDHPNVVPMYDAGEADGVLYIAMRFVDGVDLATLIARDGPLEPARTARIVAQVASALDAAHEAGLVHRDVKPSNVLLPARGAGRGEHAYLGDFGLTKRVLSESGVTGSSAFIGTIAYVAPEQIEGQAVDARADQYSLACLTYECLTGRKPFERETDIATLYAHIRDPFPSVGDTVPANLATAVDATLARAAAKKPADRYPSCGDMAEDLLRAADATPGTGQVPVVAKQKPSRSPRRRLLIGAGSVLAVALAGIGGFLLLGNLGPPGALLTGHGLVAIDATTGDASVATDLAEEPTALAADDTAAWIVHFSTGLVSRVDAVTGDLSLIDVGAGPQGITTGNLAPEAEDPELFVWVTNTTDETLTEIDADQPDRSAPVQTLGFRPGGIAYGDGYLWIIDAQLDALVQRDTATRRPVGEPIEVGAGPVAVAAGDGAAWVSNSLDRSISRIPATFGSADAPIGLSFTPGALAFDHEAGALWIVDTDGDAVLRLDANTRREVERIDVGQTPVAVAVGAGSVWVANEFDGSVSRIDPATNTVIDTIVIGGAPRGIAVSGNTVWVAVAEP
ncbi:MAG TPA: serine/threonine-protein kinase [Candidatus Limnocylindria bacterium]|nr:serine/threonine-protein kinase [Candidatus Limnocylindria bacterium]